MKMKLLLIAIILTVLSGCAQWLPASAVKKGDNQYEVTAFGNAFAGRDTLQAKVDKKAAKLCAKGIEKEGRGKYETRHEQVYINGFPQTNTFFAFSKVVHCKT